MDFHPRLLARLTLAGLFLLSGGCAVGALLDKSTGDPKDPAKYVPAHENLAVLVEDYQNPALIDDMVDHIDTLISEELVANKVAPMVNPEKLTLLRLDHPDDYKKLKLEEIGTRIGARQIIYANITRFSVASAVGTDAMKGHAEARVKVVDCVTGETRWPKDSASAGYPIDVAIPFNGDTQELNSPQMRGAIARELASRIAKLFYSATIDQPDPAPSYPESDLQ